MPSFVLLKCLTRPSISALVTGCIFLDKAPALLDYLPQFPQAFGAVMQFPTN